MELFIHELAEKILNKLEKKTNLSIIADQLNIQDIIQVGHI